MLSGLRNRAARFLQRPGAADLRPYLELLPDIAGREHAMAALADNELAAAAREVADDAGICALGREAARRGLGERPFDVQLAGTLAMLAGHANFTMKIRTSGEFPDDRCQFNRVRARPKNEKKPHGASGLTLSISQTGDVDEDATHRFFSRDFPEPGMRNQQRDDVRLPDASRASQNETFGSAVSGSVTALKLGSAITI